MFKLNYKSLSVSSAVISLALFATVGCSKKEDEKVEEKKAEVVKVESNKIKVNDDIMKMLPGTDPCFEAVEFVRDDGDLATYRDMGDKIILEKDYVEGHGHKTYIGTIGAMIKENRSIPEIRQVLLNKCRAFGVAYEKIKAEKIKEIERAKEAEKAKETEKAKEATKAVEKES